MTSLSSQLKQIRNNNTNVGSNTTGAGETSKHAPSLLVSSRAAAQIEIDVIYAQALNGLAELNTFSDKFDSFEEGLFSAKTKAKDRRLMTGDEVKALNHEIALFLSHVCPFYLLKPAQKCLEYLVRHFKIHEHNISEIMGCIFPYHESTPFVKMIKILSFKNNSQWSWLRPFQKADKTLDRISFAQRCLIDKTLVTFIAKSTITILTVNDFNAKRLNTLLAGYTSLVITAIEIASEIKEELVLALLPSILDGFNYANECSELCLSSYLILCSLSMKIQFSNDLIRVILEHTIEQSPEHLQGQAFSSLLVFSQTQEILPLHLNRDLFLSLCQFNDIPAMIAENKEKTNVDFFTTLFTNRLLDEILDNDVDLENETEVEESQLFWDLLLSLVDNDVLTKELISFVLEKLFSLFADSNGGKGDGSEDQENISKVFIATSTRYPLEMDEEMSKALTYFESQSKKSNKNFTSILTKCFTGTRYQPIDGLNSVYICLNHPVDKLREQGVEQLLNVDNDDEFVFSSLQNAFRDSSSIVISKVLEILPNYLEKNVGQEKATQIFFSLTNLLSKDKNPNTKIIIKVMKAVTGPLLKVYPELLDQVVPYVFSYLSSNNKNYKIVRAIKAQVYESKSLMGHPAFIKVSKEHFLTESQFEGVESEDDVSDLLVKINNTFADAVVESLLSFPEAKDIESHFLQLIATLKKQNDSAEKEVGVDANKGQLESFIFLVSSRFVVKYFNSSFDGQKAKKRVKDFVRPLLVAFSDELRLLNCNLSEIPVQIDEAEALLHFVNHSATKKKRFAKSVFFVSLLKSMVNGLENVVDDSTVWLFVDLFSLATRSVSGDVGVCNALLTAVLTCLKGQELLFLSLCCSPRSISDQFLQSTPMVQLRGLRMMQVYIQASAKSGIELHSLALLLPCIFTNLQSPVQAIRSACIQLLESIASVDSKDKKIFESDKSFLSESAVWHTICRDGESIKDKSVGLNLKNSKAQELVTMLLERKKEFTLDKEHVAQFIGEFATATVSKLDAVVSFIFEYSCLVGDVTTRSSLYEVMKMQTRFQKVLPIVCTEGVSILTLSESRLMNSYCINEDEPVFDTFYKEEIEIISYIMDMYNETSAPLLERTTTDVNDITTLSVKKQMFWCLISCIKNRQLGKQIEALQRITDSFFQKCSLSVQNGIITALSDILREGTHRHTVNTYVKHVLANLSLKASHIQFQIKRSGFIYTEPSSTAKRSRVDSDAEEEDVDSAGDEKQVTEVTMRRAVVILEALQQLFTIDEEDAQDQKEKTGSVSEVENIIPNIFSCLERCVAANYSDRAALEYVKQLSLSVLGGAFVQISKRKAILDKVENHVNVELVVQCIRSTDNPRTHQRALLLLANVAGLYPKRVLDNIMSIFTFMGDSFMRQDDNYSFHIIQHTVETVIPPLLLAHKESQGRQQDGAVNMMLEIIKVFVNAYAHIPRHRRLRLFTHLVTTLGPDVCLAPTAIFLLLKRAESSLQSVSMGDEGATEIPIVDFCASLIQQFSLSMQVSNFVNLLELITVLPNTLPSNTSERNKVAKKLPRVPQFLFLLSELSERTLRKMKLEVLRLINECMSMRSFVHDLKRLQRGGEQDEANSELEESKRENENTEDSTENVKEENSIVQSCFIELLRSNLSFITMSNQFEGVLKKQEATHSCLKVWKAVIQGGYGVMHRIVNSLSLNSFVGVLSELIKHEDTVIRRKALLLFSKKLEQHKDELEQPHIELFIGMVNGLVEIANQKDGNEDIAVLKQMSLLNCEILARSFAKENAKPFLHVLPTLLGENILHSNNNNVVSSTLVCLASFISSLGIKIISFLPTFFPHVLELFRTTLQAAEKGTSFSPLLLVSIATVLNATIATVPQFLSPYIADVVSLLSHPYFGSKEKEGHFSKRTQEEQLDHQIKSGRRNLTKVSPRILFPAILSAYNQVTSAKSKGNHAKDQSKMCISSIKLIELLTHSLEAINRSDIVAHYKLVFKFFLTCLDFRSICSATIHEVNEVESACINSFVVLVMKLSEVTFKPLFGRLISWLSDSSNLVVGGGDNASEDQDAGGAVVSNKKKYLNRQLAFYHVILKLSENLKNIFVPYFHHIIPLCITVLNDCNEAKSLKGSIGHETETCVLLRYVLLSLKSCFLYDTQGALTKEIFNDIYVALVDQLENEVGGFDSYQLRSTKCVVPTIANLAASVRDDEMWKKLNYQILQKTRHHETQVRFAALLSIKELYVKLGEEFLVLLPETIPFLAECMEDESQEIENLSQDVITTIETYLGESIQQYF